MNDLLIKSRAVLADGYAKHRPVVAEPAERCQVCETEWPCQKATARARRLKALAALPAPPTLTELAVPATALVWQPDLRWFDWIVVESSGGKDSQAMLDVVCRLAAAQGVLDRVVVVHADLGRVEWDESVDLGDGWRGTADLAARQAAVYGVRFIIVRNIKETLLEEILRRRKFPDAARRYCTSDQKRGPARALMTKLVGELGDMGRPARILNCLGMRGQESCGRAKLAPFELDEATAVTRKWVWRWLPIHDWTVDQVWNRIQLAERESGSPRHPIYAKGLTRASCSLCVLASKPDLLLAIRLRPGLAREVAAIEAEIGHDFRLGMPMRDLIAEAEADDDESPEDLLSILFDSRPAIGA